MKKFILLLLTFVMLVCGVSYTVRPTAQSKENEGTVFHTLDAVPSSPNKGYLSSTTAAVDSYVPAIVEAIQPTLPDVEEDPVEQIEYNDDIPLSHEEQGWLQSACKEFEVPYALALGLIEKETHFQNVVGDDGASTGYMQIQQKWHWDRMNRLGVTDLLDPEGNFQVGCDFLSELYGKYGDWSLALTVYNMGHNPGYITKYAYDVMGNYARWQETTQIFD